MDNHDRELRQQVERLVASLPHDVLITPGRSTDLKYGDYMLPFELYRNTGRQNIIRVADQINMSFHFNIYDGCSVLMRRLVEMLLILAFKKHAIDPQIRNSDGNYLELSEVVKRAIASSTLDLSRNAKDDLDLFREQGNLSAHNPFYSARQADLERVQAKFRHLVEELLYKSGIIQ
jgi:hypothetical protein